MIPYGGMAKQVASQIARARVGNALAGVGVVAGTYAWAETTGATIGIIVAIVSGIGYLYRTLIKPLVHAIFEVRDELKKLDAIEGRVKHLESVIVHKEGT